MKCVNRSARICLQILAAKCEQAGFARRKRVFQVLNALGEFLHWPFWLPAGFDAFFAGKPEFFNPETASGPNGVEIPYFKAGDAPIRAFCADCPR